ncbi:hypothetical protein EP30_01225 [Bifidobacterium sp. UTCIF-39]|uniref:helix-turn-helix domain-containing protein n=1 Tax=Bifidobacterium sp. UTCIF-39 TaxID=1465359 RepID=UPI0015E381D2|nr:helix-turn-helix transcriptional regulator [Bifidobacterium sp. UTCIF-39]TPF97593.1 hypothetical protein EP30_01225 [Bifidobacterium sp. UTCIF-39]
MSNSKNRGQRFSQLIGLELKASFVRLQISQSQVADRLGHSRSGYSKWINAKPSMPIEALLNTCEFIGVDPRAVIDSAYRRLIEEMGEVANSPDADDARVKETSSRTSTPSQTKTI